MGKTMHATNAACTLFGLGDGEGRRYVEKLMEGFGKAP